MKSTRLMILIFILFCLITCGQPPEGIKEVNLINFIQDSLQELNRIKDNKELQKNYFKNLMENFNVLFVLLKDTSLVINSKPALPEEHTISYTLDGNKFIIAKPLYITVENKEVLISFDNSIWYSPKNDDKNNIEGLKNNYNFETNIENETKIYIDYQMAFSLGANPTIIKVNKDKEVVRLKKGMIFADKDEKKITVDLNKKILFIPEKTILSGRVNVEGNLIDSKTTDEGIISIKALQSLFVYFYKMSLSLSFDKNNWDVSVLSFDIEPSFKITAIDNDKVFFDIYTSAVYDKNKKSLSIVKLLIKAF